MFGMTPPDAIVTPPSSLFSSSSLRTAFHTRREARERKNQFQQPNSIRISFVRRRRCYQPTECGAARCGASCCRATRCRPTRGSRRRGTRARRPCRPARRRQREPHSGPGASGGAHDRPGIASLRASCAHRAASKQRVASVSVSGRIVERTTTQTTPPLTRTSLTCASCSWLPSWRRWPPWPWRRMLLCRVLTLCFAFVELLRRAARQS